MHDLLDKVRRGEIRAIARLITLLENDAAIARDAVGQLYPMTGRAHVVGITGPPGCGKSTLVNEIAKTLNDMGLTVGIIAVDPSSPFTGGALLGDRVRMADITNREGIFVRSMASRGTLGGLAQTTSATIKVLDSAGYEVILVETVGAGQAEVDIASVAHTVLVVEVPGSGDEVQSIKAGILEIADILVVNKADRPSVMHTVRLLEMMLQLGQPGYKLRMDKQRSDEHHSEYDYGELRERAMEIESGERWSVPVLQTIATDGSGIEELVSAMRSHLDYLHDSGDWTNREVQRSRREIDRLMQQQMLSLLEEEHLSSQRELLVAAVTRRELDPYTAASHLLSMIKPRTNQ